MQYNSCDEVYCDWLTTLPTTDINTMLFWGMFRMSVCVKHESCRIPWKLLGYSWCHFQSRVQQHGPQPASQTCTLSQMLYHSIPQPLRHTILAFLPTDDQFVTLESSQSPAICRNWDQKKIVVLRFSSPCACYLKTPQINIFIGFFGRKHWVTQTQITDDKVLHNLGWIFILCN